MITFWLHMYGICLAGFTKLNFWSSPCDNDTSAICFLALVDQSHAHVSIATPFKQIIFSHSHFGI